MSNGTVTWEPAGRRYPKGTMRGSNGRIKYPNAWSQYNILKGTTEEAKEDALHGFLRDGKGRTERAKAAIDHAGLLGEPATIAMLAFPIDVKTDAMQGHYIMFHIKEWEEGGTLTGNKLQRQGRKRRNVSGSGFENVNDYSLMLTNRPHTRLAASIALYMPPQVNASYGIKYADKEVGVVAHGAAEAVNVWRTTSGAGSVTKGIGKLIMPFIETAVKEQGLKVFDAMIPGLSAVEGITSGNVVTPHMELMFEGVGRREFSFSFVMIPKSAKEAKAVDDIVKQFKLGMHPEYTVKEYFGFGAAGDAYGSAALESKPFKTRAMKFPSVFHIEYFYKGAINKHLHKISTCYLTKMDVSHGGDRYAAYAGGVPQKTMITLNFTEMEIMTREHIEAGY